MPKPVTVDHDAQPNVAADVPPAAQCNFNHRYGPPQNNTFDPIYLSMIVGVIDNKLGCWHYLQHEGYSACPHPNHLH